MLRHQVELKIVDWDDVAFRQTVERAFEVIRTESVDADSDRAAEHLQRLLRRVGYPRATVVCVRSVDEALEHVAHFEVRREIRGGTRAGTSPDLDATREPVVTGPVRP